MNSLGYLCEFEANVYDIDFTRFRIRDLDTETILFEVHKSTDSRSEPSRYVRYQFPPAFLELKTIGAT